MSVYRTVNPKKLRPYDEPPRRRLLNREIPHRSATAFLVVAALWVAVATGIGVLAIGLRALDVRFSIPLGIFDLSFELDARRAEYAFVAATVYGWLTNAGLGAALFILPRLAGRALDTDATANLGLGIYNASLIGGLTWLYFGDLPTVAALSSLHPFADVGMVLGLIVVLAAFVRIAGEAVGGERYISSWFFAAALPALVALTVANVAIDVINPPEVPLALASLYLERAVDAFWLFGVAAGTLYYVVPRVSGNPLYSLGLARLSWIAWLLLAPIVGLAALDDVSIPYWVTSIGNVATMLMIVPVFLLVANLVLTLSGRWTLVFGVGSLPFAIVSLAFLMASAVLAAIGSLRNVEGLVGNTDWQLGLFTYAALGAYTFAMFALADHALPRLLRREWGGGVVSAVQLWAGFAGATIAGLGLMASGLAGGAMRLAGTDPEAANGVLLWYRAVVVGGIGLVALAGLALLLNVFFMYTAGRRAEYVQVTTPGSASAPAH